MLDLHTVTQWVVLVIVALMGVVWIALSARLGNWLKAHASFLNQKQQAQVVDTAHTIFQAAANWLIKYVSATGDKVHPQMNNPIERFAVQLALDHPGSVIGDPNVVAAHILAKIPPTLIADDTTGATVALTPKVETRPLAPVGG